MNTCESSYFFLLGRFKLLTFLELNEVEGDEFVSECAWLDRWFKRLFMMIYFNYLGFNVLRISNVQSIPSQFNTKGLIQRVLVQLIKHGFIKFPYETWNLLSLFCASIDATDRDRCGKYFNLHFIKNDKHFSIKSAVKCCFLPIYWIFLPRKALWEDKQKLSMNWLTF